MSTVRDEGSSESRLDELKEDVANLRIRGGSARTEQQFKIGGAILIPVGLVLIGLGWFGASDTVFVDEQMSYLISGGLLGLALVATGGCLYLRYWLARERYWLARLTVEQEQQSQELLAALGRIEEALRGSGGGRVPVSSGSPSRAE
jgi:hypothetical protein